MDELPPPKSCHLCWERPPTLPNFLYSYGQLIKEIHKKEGNRKTGTTQNRTGVEKGGEKETGRSGKGKECQLSVNPRLSQSAGWVLVVPRGTTTLVPKGVRSQGGGVLLPTPQGLGAPLPLASHPYWFCITMNLFPPIHPSIHPSITSSTTWIHSFIQEITWHIEVRTHTVVLLGWDWYKACQWQV